MFSGGAHGTLPRIGDDIKTISIINRGIVRLANYTKNITVVSSML